MSTNARRVPPGSPEGGQFADGGLKPESSSASLNAHDRTRPVDAIAFAAAQHAANEGDLSASEALEAGEMTDVTERAIMDGRRLDESVEGFRSRIASALSRDLAFSRIDEATWNEHVVRTRAALTSPGLSEVDLHGSLEDISLGCAAQLQAISENAVADGDAAHDRAARWSARAVLERGKARMRSEAVAEIRARAASDVRDERDLDEAMTRSDGARQSRIEQATFAALSADDVERAEQVRMGVYRVTAVANRLTDERDAYVRDEFMAKLDADVESGAVSFRRAQHARETIAAGAYSMDTRRHLQAARLLPTSANHRRGAVDALARDTLVREIDPNTRMSVKFMAAGRLGARVSDEHELDDAFESITSAQALDLRRGQNTPEIADAIARTVRENRHAR